MRWCCATRGHVTALTEDHIVECVICEKEPKRGEKIHQHVARGGGEMSDFRDVANVSEWGHADTGQREAA
jgi:hypothetical protein